MGLDKFTRRNFLRSIALLAGAVAASKLPIKPEYLDASFRQPANEVIPKPEFIEYPLGNLNLTVILTEHTEEASEQNFPTIKKVLDTHKLIIPEYFPPDYEPEIDKLPWLRDKIANNYQHRNALFSHIEHDLSTRDDNVEIKVLDPAYSGAAILLRLENNWPFAFNTALLDTALIEGIINRHKNNSQPDSFKVEKDGISLLGGGLATIFGAMITQSSTYGTETDLRRVFIAQGLHQLSKMVKPGTQAAIIYPGGHWHGDYLNGGIGIKDFIENDQLRGSFYNEFARFRKARYYKDLYNTRAFILNEHQWVRQPGFELV